MLEREAIARQLKDRGYRMINTLEEIGAIDRKNAFKVAYEKEREE